jgi:putative ABC transport system ATP-binding protein
MRAETLYMAEQYAVELEHLRRIYKRDEFEVRALDDVTIGIPAGRFVAIMGPSGSGKTTLLDVFKGARLRNQGFPSPSSPLM